MILKSQSIKLSKEVIGGLYMTLNAKIMEEREEERIENILTIISILKRFGIQDSKIIEQISEQFCINSDETDKYLEKYYEEADKTNS